MPTKSYTAYKLRFRGPMHISNNRDDYGTSLTCYPSDSMHAALLATLAKMGEELPKNGDLGCVISSLFPFYQNSPDSPAVLFFPKPLSLTPIQSDNAADIKRIKGIQWIDKTILQSILGGNSVIGLNPTSCIKGDFMTCEAIEEPFILHSLHERATISRSFDVAKPFLMERILFKGYSGLFFLVEGESNLIDYTLPLLSEEGIGTDRNVGNGSFSYEKTSINIDIPEKADYGLSLSTFIPESKNQMEDLLDGDSVAYELVRRGGWISTPPHLNYRKNSIYSFAPGSVLHNLITGAGRIVDLAPQGVIPHPIWRSGKTLSLPIII